MTRLTTIFTSVVLATALLPVGAGAQATRRGGGSDGGGSSSSGSRGGSESGGGVAVPRNPSPAPPSPSPRGESGSAPSNSGSARPSGSRAPAGSDTRVTSAGPGNNRGAQDLRLRSAQAARGVAQPRGTVRPAPRDYGSRWNPWYSYGPYLYYDYGYYGYSPYRYGRGSWSWNRYGWHDPFLFDPFGYASYAPYYWQSSGGVGGDRDDGVPTGSLRLRVSPGHARVYVDGALAGIASEFGGLTNHLTIPAGLHEIEFRAEGFAPFSTEVNVEEGRTRTERIGLKKLPATQPGN
jgi:hypothetical protein